MHYFSRLHLTETGIDQCNSKSESGIYGIHQELWKLFPNSEKSSRNFIFSIINERTVYCVSEKKPMCDDGSWIIETKNYDPCISEGELLRFRMCVNPTVANDSTGHHRRHDVVMNLKAKYKEQDIRKSQSELESEASDKWIRRKSALNGFELVCDVSAHSYARNKIWKSAKNPIIISSIVLEGVMKVKDPEKVKDMLFKGIGSAKGFGFGMVMVKRPR